MVDAYTQRNQLRSIRQIVLMELKDGALATLSVHGHDQIDERYMRYDGTDGSIVARVGLEEQISLTDYHSGKTRRFSFSDHGRKDDHMMDILLDAHESDDWGEIDNIDWFESHLLAFSAEESRVGSRIIDIERRRARIASDISDKSSYNQQDNRCSD